MALLLYLREDPLAYSCSPPSRVVLVESRPTGRPEQSSSGNPCPTATSEAPEKVTNLMNVGPYRPTAFRPCYLIDYRPKAGTSVVEEFVQFEDVNAPVDQLRLIIQTPRPQRGSLNLETLIQDWPQIDRRNVASFEWVFF